MYWKICIVGIFQVYKIKFFFYFKKGPISALYRPSKSAGISYIHIFIKAVPVLLKTPGPIPALLKSAGTGPHDLIPTFKKRRSEAPGKKNAGIGILTLSQRFLGLSQRFSKRWDSPIFCSD